MDPSLNATTVASNEYPLVGLRTCWYLLLPQETYFETLKDMPALTARAIPPGSILLIFEVLVLLFTGRLKEFRIHNAMISWSSTAMYEAFSFFLIRGLEWTIYQYLYENFRIFTMPYDNVVTFCFALITVEFLGYWWHRMSHELAIMWASHELHHSSDDFNLSVGFRNSAPMRIFRWVFYIPLAFFGIPTSIMLTHLTLGSIYNGAIHLHSVPKLHKIIPGLGHFLEYLFVTPSHHRVHHASNQYCIDKNYGQYLIIFDRMFGTFAEEKEDEPLVYGTLTQPKSYNMAYLQVSSFISLWQKFQSMTTIGDKFRALFYGPGWFPGTPRLGNDHEIPDVRGRAKYDPKYPIWMSFYLVLNAFGVFISYLNMAGRTESVPKVLQLLNLIYIFYGYTSVGGLYDKQKFAAPMELTRILILLGIVSTYPEVMTPSTVTTCVINMHYVNLIMWPFVAMYVYSDEKLVQDDESLIKPVVGEPISKNGVHKVKKTVNSVAGTKNRKYKSGQHKGVNGVVKNKGKNKHA